LYDGGIRMTDERIGALFDRMRRNDLFDDTLIVLLSDHGEEFGEHDSLRHEQIYQELLHVPLIVRFPGKAEWRGRREDAVVRLIDLLPTQRD
jgi:choline-sulfatase